MNPSLVKFKIRNIFKKLKFSGKSVLLQYWECKPTPDGYSYSLIVDLSLLTNKKAPDLDKFKMNCEKYSLGDRAPEFEGDNFFPEVAVQTGVANQRPVDDLDGQFMGHLVVPVYNLAGVNEFFGVIELAAVTGGSYEEFFNRINRLLKDEGLATKGPLISPAMEKPNTRPTRYIQRPDRYHG